jgi:hypothetical protein
MKQHEIRNQEPGVRMLKMLVSFATATIIMTAQTTGPILNFTATTDNVGGAPDSIRIDVLRWSTDSERDEIVKSWTNPVAPAATTGRGGGRGRGAAAAAPDDPFAAANDAAAGDANAPAPAAAAPAAGRGAGAGRGGAGRGGGRGGGGTALPDAPPPTPESSLTAALGKAATVGHLWSSEVAGYSLRYAVKLPAQDGGERIIFITDRRLGAWNDLWKPNGNAAPSTYEFSVIELRLNSKGEGDGKISLSGKLVVDTAAKTLALENYGALPVVLKGVKRK